MRSALIFSLARIAALPLQPPHAILRRAVVGRTDRLQPVVLLGCGA